MKIKKKNILSILLFLLIMSVYGIAAYFTDTDMKTNVFEVGNVDIELSEPSWEKPIGIVPNQAIPKDPIVVNTGVNDAYVYMTVDVPYILDGEQQVELFDYNIDSNWTEIDAVVNGNCNVMKHTYAYVSDNDTATLEVLSKNQRTSALFNEVVFANLSSSQGLEGLSLDMVINAYAIQTNDMDNNAMNVWNVIKNEYINVIQVVAKDTNGKNLNATATLITGKQKEELLSSIESAGLANVNDVVLLIDVKSDDFEGMAETTFNVGSIAKKGDKVTILHYNETQQEWEYISTDIVGDDLTVSGNFSSYSPVAFVVIPQNEDLNGEAYAIYSKTDSSLTFMRADTEPLIGEQYDGKVISNVYKGFESDVYEITTMDPDTLDYYTTVPWDNQRYDIKSVVFKDVIRPISTAYWFKHFDNCVSMNMAKLDTSDVQSMDSMFYYCENLKSLDVSRFDTSSVQNMDRMFACCEQLINIDVDGFDTSKVKSMYGMFFACHNINMLDLNSFNTSSVTNMHEMLSGCSQLETVYVSDLWDIENVSTSQSIFGYSFNIKGQSGKTYNGNHLGKEWANYETGYFTYKNAENISTEVQLITGPEFNEIVKDNADCIKFIYKAASTDIGTIDVSAAQDGSVLGWFDNRTFYVAPKNAGDIIFANPDSSYMFLSADDTSDGWATGTETTSIDFENFNTSKVLDMSGMFIGIYTEDEDDVELSRLDTSNVVNMYDMFEITNIKSLSMIEEWDVSNVTNMSNMFYDANLSSELDLSRWDTSNVTEIHDMFHHTSSNNGELELILSGWDLSKVKSLNGMFLSLAHQDNVRLDLTNWDVSNVESMVAMFEYTGYGDYSTFIVQGLDTWNTSSVKDMSYMFYAAGSGATEWSIGDISGWDTSNVENMSQMFRYAGSNADYTIDVSGWDVSNVGEYKYFDLGVESKIISPWDL